MEQKLTNEEVARVFAMYWSAKYQLESGGEHEVNGSNMKFIACEENTSRKLILKPLSAISIEVCRLIAELVYTRITDEDVQLAKNFVLYQFGGIGLSMGEVNKLSEFEDTDIYLQTIDLLREHNYALPYKGQDLFQLGIAIEAVS